MQITVTQDGNLIHQAEFVKGPVHIGRHPQCQIYLSSPIVSRHQAAFYVTEKGQWMINNLQFEHQVQLNGKPVEQSPIHDGDRIAINNYTIEVKIDESGSVGLKSALEDTQVPAPNKTRGLKRELDAKLSPPLRIPAHRSLDLLAAARQLTEAHGEKETHKVLLDVLKKQFRARRVWAAFRHEPEGAMAAKGGVMEYQESFVPTDPTLRKRIDQAREKRLYYLLINEKLIEGQTRKQSALIVPIPGTTGNLGAFYVDSRPEDPPYAPSELDYAVLLSINIGIVLENF